jgi:hypothetical protein
MMHKTLPLKRYSMINREKFQEKVKYYYKLILQFTGGYWMKIFFLDNSKFSTSSTGNPEFGTLKSLDFSHT